MTDNSTTCSSCGTTFTGVFCSSCGVPAGSATPTTRVPTVPLAPPPAQVAPAPAAPSGGSGGGMPGAAIGALVALLAVAVVGGAFFLGRGGSATATSTTTSSTTTTSTTSTTTTAPTTLPPTTAPAPAGPGDVRLQPAGLFCRDLKAKGFSYSASVDYWRQQGQADRLDADKDGIPCETVFPSGDVIAYWGTLGQTVTVDESDAGSYNTGLLCRDLAARGATTYDALTYYVITGYPARMDADGNGIPCESVYPDAAFVWDYYFGQ